jgi:diguanylate cyclase (GGDEF)-like protein
VPRLAATGAVSGALLLPLVERGETEAVVVLVRRYTEPFSPVAVELAVALVDQAATALALRRARAEAGTDAVTGCMNHRAMRRRLDEEIGRAARAGGSLSCLLIDLDDFKSVNDMHGHQAGDAMLRAVVHALVGEFRAFDRVARYGGDEFVVILPNAALGSAAAAAGRALERLRAIPTPDGAGVSASIGVSQWQAPMSTDELLEACDIALLRSKRQGKGRVTRASASGEPAR